MIQKNMITLSMSVFSGSEYQERFALDTLTAISKAFREYFEQNHKSNYVSVEIKKEKISPQYKKIVKE